MSDPKPFAYDLTHDDIQREKTKARTLRATQWWKRRVAKGPHFKGRALGQIKCRASL